MFQLFISSEVPSYLWKYTCHPDKSGTKSHITLQVKH